MPDTNETFTERVDVTTQPDGAFIGTLEIDAPTTGREADHQEELNEAIEVGHGRSDPLVTHAKMLGLELPKVKADLEPELEDFSLNCSKCGLDVQWVTG